MFFPKIPFCHQNHKEPDTLVNGGGGSIDLFHSCSTPLRCGVPINWLSTQSCKGYQFPKTGNAYAGLAGIVNVSNGTEYREYIQGNLIQSLENGNQYCVKLSISLANCSEYSCVSMGVYFDNGQIQSFNNQIPSPQIIPQILNTYLLDDTLNWMQIEESFISNGTEEYINIGNFYHDSLSGIAHSYPAPPFSLGILKGAYYYIDDISVIDISTPAYAGNDTLLLTSDTVYLGRPSEIGLDEACIWFLDGVPIDTAAGIWVVPDSTSIYVLQQTLCGNVQYDTVTVTVDTGTGMERIKNQEIKIFPNPSSGEVWYHLAEDGKASLEVYSMDGKLLYQEMVSNRFKNNQIEYNFDRGVYVVVIRMENGIFREKVVVR